jgi:putative (di)nucleoside polyphosphate hydrolase
MKEEYKILPYRNNAGIIVLKDDKFLLVQLNEWSGNLWKFPQGGCNEGEDPEETALREFKEELGSDKIEIKHKSSFQNIYDFPDDKIEIIGKKWRGQKQTFFIANFVDDENNLNPDPKEIRTYKWCSREELEEHLSYKDAIFYGYYDFILKVLEEFDI